MPQLKLSKPFHSCGDKKKGTEQFACNIINPGELRDNWPAVVVWALTPGEALRRAEAILPVLQALIDNSSNG